MTAVTQPHPPVGRDETKCATCGRPHRVHDLEFMNNPDLWPTWPLLPLRRSVPDEPYEVGFITHQEAGEPVVLYGKTIYEVAEARADKECQTTYADFEALYDAGWRVD